MLSDIELWRFIMERLVRDESVVLMVVAKSSGSSPGRPGFKMAVAADDICGSIGGGVMEVALVEQARAIVESDCAPDPEPVRQVHRENSEHGSGMICSGEQTVLLKRLVSSDIETVKRIVEINDEPRYVIVLKPDMFDVTRSILPKGFERFDAEEYVYTEEIGRKNELFIIGGGHCALALSGIMAKLGFRITVFDDRPNLNTLAKNEYADRVSLIESYEMIGESVQSGDSNYVVVMTLGYKYDKVVIRNLLAKHFRYFGVLGSKAKMKVLMRELKDEGFDPGRLDAIHSPIGVDINSRTPEEIAVSIAAEIISIKNAEQS